MSLEHEIITPAVATAVRDVAIHLGTGAIATVGAASIQMYQAKAAKKESINLVLTLLAGGTAAVAGPHLFGSDISAYLHDQTIGGVALGTLGAAASCAVAGGYFLDNAINDHSGNESGYIGKVMGFMGGAVAGPAIYLAIEAAGYFR